jgi:hypothetical protein
MTTAPATALNKEVGELIDVQIETFTRPSSLTSCELGEFHHRTEKLRVLCQELNRIGTGAILERRFGVAA